MHKSFITVTIVRVKMNNPEDLPWFTGDKSLDYADSGWAEEHITELDLPE